MSLLFCSSCTGFLSNIGYSIKFCCRSTNPWITVDQHISALLQLPTTQRLRTSLLLIQPRPARTKYGERAFSWVAPQLWNTLPRDIRFASSVNRFKSMLKTYLFKKCFCDVWIIFVMCTCFHILELVVIFQIQIIYNRDNQTCPDITYMTGYTIDPDHWLIIDYRLLQIIYINWL